MSSDISAQYIVDNQHDLPMHVTVTRGYGGQHEYDTLLEGEFLTLCCVRQHMVLVCEDKSGMQITIGQDNLTKFTMIGRPGTSGDAESSVEQCHGRTYTVGQVMDMGLPVVIRPFHPQGTARRNKPTLAGGGANVHSSALTVMAVRPETLLLAATLDDEVLAIPVYAQGQSEDDSHNGNMAVDGITFASCSGSHMAADGGPALTAKLGRLLPYMDLGVTLLDTIHC